MIQIFYSKVSYLIVDQAEKDMEVSKGGIPNDPFLDAEIDIPSPLSPIVRKPSFKRSRNQDSLSNALEETAIPQGTPRVVLKNMKPLNTADVTTKDSEDRNGHEERMGPSSMTEMVFKLDSKDMNERDEKIGLSSMPEIV